MTHRFRTLALSALFVAGLAATATAALPERPWLVRGRVSQWQPNDGSGLYTVPTLAGAGLGVQHDWGASFDVSFFPHRNLALELSMGLAQPDFVGTEAGKGLGELATATMLPATLTVQWHPFANKVVRPYLGFGAAYTGFFNERATGTLEDAMGGPTDVDMNDSFGVVGQVGLDVVFCKNWVVNVDVRYSEADTTVETESATLMDEVNVDVNPWTFSTGVGYRF